MNVFYNTIIFVKDIPTSKAFYQDVIGLKIVQEYDTIVFFENHFTIHDGNALLETIFKKKESRKSLQGKQNLEIYFETDAIEESFRKVVDSHAAIIHGIEAQFWGQRVFRFYDPDQHIVEIGEAMHLEELMGKKNESQSEGSLGG